MNSEIRKKIDILIQKYAENIVGTGYNDIIVSRENYIALIDELTEIGIPAVRITWWCLCNKKNKTLYGCPHGAGGPGFEWGHYGEIYWEQDSIEKVDEDIGLHHCRIKELIKNKIVQNRDGGTLSFSDIKCLTPAICLNIEGNNSYQDKRN